ncbi:MAG TPA: manganese efflux pump MntP family protein, partial [Firmicutes bacterium]|nr:manganese efflux pump MntP family protein [Bacillota bacterium]
TPKLVFVQAIATSIDALAVGVSFAAMTVQIWTAVSVIAVTTFILSFCSVRIGKRFGDLLNHKAEILGGLILIGIGLKIFIEHMLG